MAIIIRDPNTFQDAADKAKAQRILDGIRYFLDTDLTEEELSNAVILNDIFTGVAEREVLSSYNKGKSAAADGIAPDNTIINTAEDFDNIFRQEGLAAENPELPIIEAKLVVSVQYRILLELIYSYREEKQSRTLDTQVTFFQIDFDKKEALFKKKFNESITDLVPTAPTTGVLCPPKAALTDRKLGF